MIRRVFALAAIILAATLFMGCPDCNQLALLLQAAKASGNQAAIDAAQKAYDDAKCSIPVPVPTPTPTPVPTPMPEPTPTPTPTPEPPPVPPPADACFIDGEPGAPIPGYHNALGAQVNAAMVALRPDCVVGSRCLLASDGQAWQAQVEQKLREGGLCAGQHAVDTDEIAVATSQTAAREGFHVAAGGGAVRWTVVWSPGADRGAYAAPASEPPPPVTPPPAASGCPYPLPATCRINAKAHVGKQLDSTPQCFSYAYCAARGWTDGRIWCALAQESDPARPACEAVLLGHPCPVWRFVGDPGGLRLEYSGEPSDVARCGTDSGFLVWVVGKGTGKVQACNADGSLCSDPVGVAR